MSAERTPIADVRARRGQEGDHGAAARGMFERIAPTYDTVNAVLSAGSDRRWRATAVREIERAPSGPVLDLCAGTLDLSALVRRARPRDRVVAADFSSGMLEAGKAKVRDVETVVADATALPFADAEFSAVICGFGMRNLGDPAAGAREARRVLRPGGIFVTLELFRPTRTVTRAFHRGYARLVLPVVGGWLSGDRGAYRYLAGSMGAFLTRQEYQQTLVEAGFEHVRGRDLTLGIAAVVTGEVSP